MTKTKKDAEVEPDAPPLRRGLITEDMLDKLMDASDERGVALAGGGILLPEMIKAFLSAGWRRTHRPAELCEGGPGRARVRQLPQREHPEDGVYGGR